mmetsp:Transcript_16370/g.24125  ORF Transcript_16370/g.24125 Transcript_16370/m.24125 type:complete len:448 (-) Transcript_16370:38-1381(-)|eukprot:CAMPEP_0194237148 /NCGR_PEP_ID=MMETSP0158-20130606/4217_1 /TAXON_ID=33649 /ORGANISM="Thalassionema nitzschioides, Strain L26-B" /LENGTH=447 /DNA_ID=CAMNT_0038971079 /DNA_START=203 /DNA_END=1546 /DNA_ORIENTATION=+
MTGMDAKSGTFWLGVGLSLAGSFCSALGLALQRLSHKRNNALPLEQRLRSTRQWLNLLGIFLLFVEALFDLASFGFAPASILSCMGAFTLVFNMILAPALCGEEVSRRDILVNCIVMSGTLVAVWFGPHETPDYDVPKLMDLFSSTRFAVYFTLLMLWIGLLLLCWWGLKDLNKPKLATFQKWQRTTRSSVLRFTYPALAGSIGGNTAVYAKAMIELVKTTIKGDNQLIYFGFYLMIVLMLLSLLGQLNFLNAGLKYYDALYVVPVYQVFWITSGILGAMFFFDEVAHLTSMELGMFILGAFVAMFGISLHATRSNITNGELHEEGEGDDLMSNDQLVDEEKGGSTTNNASDNNANPDANNNGGDYDAGAAVQTNDPDDEEEELFMNDEDDDILELRPSYSSGGGSGTGRTRSFTEEPRMLPMDVSTEGEPRTRAFSQDAPRDRTFT